jgi:hypothetical protein
MKLFPVYLGIFIRWVLDIVLIYFVCREQPGLATRLFVITTSLYIESKNMFDFSIPTIKRMEKE